MSEYAERKFTQLPGVPDSSAVRPGMAFYSGTGPERTTCGQCRFRGLYRESTRGRWSEETQTIVHKSYKTQGCQKYKSMTGHPGPDVDEGWASCRYFEQSVKK